MITYLIGGPGNEKIVPDDGGRRMILVADDGTRGDTYRRRVVETPYGRCVTVHVHDSLPVDPFDWPPEVDRDGILCRAYDRVMTHHHNDRAGRV